MRNIISKICVVSLILIVAFSCKKSDNSDNSVSNDNGEKYTIAYNLPQGETFKHRMSVESKTSQEVMGQKMEAVFNMNMEMSYYVKNVDDDNYTIDMTYNTISINMDAMGMNLSFDSNTTEEKATHQNLSPIFRAMTNTPVEMEINKHGETKSVKGFEKIYESVANATSELDAMTKEQMLAQSKEQFSEQALTEIMNQTSAVFTKEPVAVGEKWIANIERTPNVPVATTMELKLVSVKDNIATIEGAGDISTGPEGITKEKNGVQAVLKLNGTQTVTTTLDLATGWVVEANVTQNIEGTIEVEGMKIPQNTVNTIKITN